MLTLYLVFKFEYLELRNEAIHLGNVTLAQLRGTRSEHKYHLLGTHYISITLVFFPILCNSNPSAQVSFITLRLLFLHTL